MPYSSTKELPAAVKKLPSKAQRAFRQAFNSALKDGKSEAQAFKIAWSAAQKAKAKGDKAMSLMECSHEGCSRKFVDEATLHDHAESVHTLTERRSLVSKAVRTVHGKEAFLVDLSDDWLVYDVYSEGMGYLLYKQSYSLDAAGNVKLSGDSSEVVRKVSYIPAPKIETAESTLAALGIVLGDNANFTPRTKAEPATETAASQATVELSKAKSQTAHKFAPQQNNPTVCAVCNRAKGDTIHKGTKDAKDKKGS